MLAQGTCDSCVKPYVESRIGLAEQALPLENWILSLAGLGVQLALGSQVLMTLAQESWVHP